jgi:hypothetical protein
LQKIGYILYLFIFLTGCSVVKKKSVSENNIIEEPVSNLLEGVEKQNITNRNFFIQKAEIEVISDEYNQKFLASIKFNYPDSYLLSFKSKTGIEVARIFITEDTVLINDRFNKRLYFGKPENLKNKYGITYQLLPVILGDLIKSKGKSVDNIICTDNKADISCSLSGVKIDYVVDCKKMKVISASQEISLKTNYTDIKYENFVKAGNGLVPTKIRVDFNESVISVKIEKIESPWEGTIEFIPGSRYEIIELL